MTVDVNKYADELEQYRLGQIAGGSNSDILSRVAEQIIEFGRGLVRGTTPGTDVKNITNSQATILFDGDFVTSNTIDLKVDGVAISQVTFTSDHDTTAGLVRDAIDALSGITAILDPADANNRTFIVTLDSELANIAVTDVIVAAGAGQAGSVVTVTTIDNLEGVAILRHNQPAIIAGDDNYQVNDQVSVMGRGTIIVEAIATVNYGDDVYINSAIITDSAQGKFTNVSADNLKVKSGVFVESVVGTPGAPALVKIKLNEPTA